MKLGYIMLGMAVDICIIREYEHIGEFYEYKDLISMQIKNGDILSVKVDGNPRLQKTHEGLWSVEPQTLDRIEGVLQKSIKHVINGGYVSIGKIE